MDWKETIVSDGSPQFVDPWQPKLGEKVTVSLRVIENAPLEGVYLRRKINGEEALIELKKADCRKGYDYYSCQVTMNEPVVQYHFYLLTEGVIYYYNQLGMTDYIPKESFDFKLLADYAYPSWVPSSVFYQIFPDRFCNGNPSNDVKPGEYSFHGHPTIPMPWGEVPKNYDQVFCMDFYGGDLQGIADKVGYLQDIGVNALYINPIFYSATSHRYDCLDYYEVDPHLGGNEGLSQLTDRLHANQMYLIVDISINHTGTAHKWFNKEKSFFEGHIGGYHNTGNEERDYYYFKENNDYHAWEGVETLPTLNYNSEALVHKLYKGDEAIIQYWLKKPYNIDGWRFDVAHTMARLDGSQLAHRVWPEIRETIKAINPEGYIVGEHWNDCAEYLQGNEWDTAMNYYGCARPIRQFLGEHDLYLNRYEALKNYGRSVMGEQLAQRIMQHLASLPYVTQSLQMNLLDSHDVTRLHNNPDIDFDSYACGVLLMYVLPGCPSIYYGDEVGIDGRLDSVEGCRYSFPWASAEQKAAYKNLYTTLSHLKRRKKVLHHGSFKILHGQGNHFVCSRFNEEEALVAVVSKDDHTSKLVVDLSSVINGGQGRVETLLHEAEVTLKGQQLIMTLPPKASILLSIQ